MPSGAPCPALRPAEAHTMRCAQMVARQPLANHARSPLAFLPLAPPSSHAPKRLAFQAEQRGP